MKVLLSSVFGPFGVDDEYGRKENVMELYHNQVTREQGAFSLRFHHQSFGLYLIAENLTAPTVVLDFPTEERFVQELREGYDYVGISFIVPNFAKARRMAELVRIHAPEAKIVLGGHGTRIPDVEGRISHDHICKGEGVRWFRELLGEDVDAPYRHPIMQSAFQNSILGIPLKTRAAVLIPGVGCPNACRFCATSHFFDKTYTPYFDTGRELYDICLEHERHGYDAFFVMDENFLKRPERARELLRLMEANEKTWQFALFSSAEAVQGVGVDFLARLGVHFLWMGVESKREVYEKNRGIDLRVMISELKARGISVLASGILFLEHHDKETLWHDVDYLLSMESDFVQFMGLGPLPGTKVFQDYDDQGLIRWDMPFEEWHGQHMIWFRHPHFGPEESSGYLQEAFVKDYDQRGSSFLRMLDTILRGYDRYRDTTDPYMALRLPRMRQKVRLYRVVLPAMRRHAHNAEARARTDALMARFDEVLGPMTLTQRLMAKGVGVLARREVARVARGDNVYQPKTIRTGFRVGVRDLATAKLQGRRLDNLLDIAVRWGRQPVRLELGGILDNANAKALARKMRRFLAKSDTPLELSLDGIQAIEDGSLTRLLKRCKRYHARVKVVVREEADAVKAAVESLPDDIRSLFVAPEGALG